MTEPEAPFDEPWQAQVFAMTVALNEAGHFSWTDWAAVFGPKVQNAPSSEYWAVWSEALIQILQQHDISSASEITNLTHQWQDAARNTPHGQPIELSAADKPPANG